jgi:aminoglycoside phosphotransferase (APT) family kinase protein
MSRPAIDSDLVRQNLEHNFPLFQVKSVEFLGRGMDSRAFDVNGEYVFRFPQFQEAAKKLRTEIGLLPRLESHLDVAVPRFEFVGTQVHNSFPFVGYRAIRCGNMSPESSISVT